MRFLEVCLERVALREVVGVDIILASIDVQVLEIMQRLVEELQEVRLLDPLYLVILARFGDLNLAISKLTAKNSESNLTPTWLVYKNIYFRET